MPAANKILHILYADGTKEEQLKCKDCDQFVNIEHFKMVLCCCIPVTVSTCKDCRVYRLTKRVTKLL